MIDRRHWSAGMLASLALPGAARAARQAVPEASAAANVLRVAFVVAETGFDSPRVSDLYSRSVTAHIFEAPFCYDLLALPVKIRPLTAAALPEVSDDFRVWTIRLKPGIHFADDPVFKGVARELVAEDYVYAIKRFYDPALKAPNFSSLDEEGIVGLSAPRERALRERKPFDYDTPVEGLRALDRYTFQVRLRTPRPRFLANLCDSSQFGAVAREVVEAYGEDIVGHPVGTGPYRLKQWNRSSRIVLERNPNFREVFYDGEPAADDAQGQAWLARFKGRRLPLNDGIDISILEEGQTRWLSFLNGQIDYLRLPSDFASIAVPNGVLAPNLEKRGILMRRFVNPDFTMTVFNMDDPVIGGYAPERVALRRAMGLSYDIEREIHILRRDLAVPAQAAMTPWTFGYDPKYKSDSASHDPARANALLDLYGYLDRDGDGWREQPNGQPLFLQMACESSQIDRQYNEIWQKSLAAVGIRIGFLPAQWPENMKSARAGTLQMWHLGNTSDTPDGQGSLEYMFGPSIGDTNLARFKLPAFDAIYRRMQAMPDSPERAALFLEASKLVAAYMPYRMHVHRINVDLNQPWITGWRQGFFRDEQWQFVEVDPKMRARLSR
jgi:ABC-type transport system substrate-binding protein